MLGLVTDIELPAVALGFADQGAKVIITARGRRPSTRLRRTEAPEGEAYAGHCFSLAHLESLDWLFIPWPKELRIPIAALLHNRSHPRIPGMPNV
jgi:hypothetical protein